MIGKHYKRLRTYLDTLTYVLYLPNSGLRSAIPGRGREQGRFRESIKGARGAPREHGGVPREHGGALREQEGPS